MECTRLHTTIEEMNLHLVSLNIDSEDTEFAAQKFEAKFQVNFSVFDSKKFCQKELEKELQETCFLLKERDAQAVD